MHLPAPLDHRSLDRSMMLVLLALSSSEPARAAAAAWLGAFEAARERGASETAAQARANAALQRAVREAHDSGGVQDGSGMLAATAGGGASGSVVGSRGPPP